MEETKDNKKHFAKYLVIYLVSFILFIALLYFINYSLNKISQLENSVVGLKKKVESYDATPKNIIQGKDAEEIKNLLSKENYYNAKFYYEKTVDDVRVDMANTRQFMEIFLGMLAGILAIVSFFTGLQLIKKEKDYKDNLTDLEKKFNKKISEVEKNSGELTSDLEIMTAKLDEKIDKTSKEFGVGLLEVRFISEFGLAINKTSNEEKIEELKKLEKNEKYKDKLGFIYFNLGYYVGDNKQKINYYDKAIQATPKNHIAYNNRGLAKKELIPPDYEDAIKDFNEAIKLNPKYSSAYNSRGLAKTKLNIPDYEGAIKDFDKVINLNPNYFIAYNNRGSSKAYLKDYKGAIKDFDEAIKLNHDDFEAYSNRGLAKYKLKDYTGALKDCNEALKINPKYENSLKLKKLVEAKIKEQEEEKKKTKKKKSKK